MVAAGAAAEGVVVVAVEAEARGAGVGVAHRHPTMWALVRTHYCSNLLELRALLEERRPHRDKGLGEAVHRDSVVAYGVAAGRIDHRKLGVGAGDEKRIDVAAASQWLDDSWCNRIRG